MTSPLNTILSANLKDEKVNKYETDILNSLNLTDEAINILSKRIGRAKSKSGYENNRELISKTNKERYKTDLEYKEKIKHNALKFYNDNIEKEKMKRRAYYLKRRDIINEQNKARNKKNYDAKKKLKLIACQ